MTLGDRTGRGVLSKRGLSAIINAVFVTQDIDFFQHLEMHLRAEQPSLCGRDHLSYRSYYMPVKVNLPLSIRLFL